MAAVLSRFLPIAIAILATACALIIAWLLVLFAIGIGPPLLA